MIIYFFGFMYAGAITINYKTYGETIYNDDHFLTLAGSFGGIFNAASRIIYVIIFDAYPHFKKVYGSLLII